MSNCINCGKRIPEERLEVLPNTDTCVKCSEVDKRVGMMVWDQATPELVMLEGSQKERLNELSKFRFGVEKL